MPRIDEFNSTVSVGIDIVFVSNDCIGEERSLLSASFSNEIEVNFRTIQFVTVQAVEMCVICILIGNK